MEAIPEFGQAAIQPEEGEGQKVPYMNHNAQRIESYSSSYIKLDGEATEGESLDSQVMKAIIKKSTQKAAEDGSGLAVRDSQILAASMLKNKSKEDSTLILA